MMLLRLGLSLLLQVSFAWAGTQDIILKPVGNTGPEMCLILVQGASIKPERYVPLAKAIQNATNAKVK